MKNLAVAIGLMAFATAAQANDIRVNSTQAMVVQEVEIALNDRNCELTWSKTWGAESFDDFCALKLELPKGGSIVSMAQTTIISNGTAADSVKGYTSFKDGVITFKASSNLEVQALRKSLLSKISNGEIKISAIYQGPRLK